MSLIAVAAGGVEQLEEFDTFAAAVAILDQGVNLAGDEIAGRAFLPGCCRRFDYGRRMRRLLLDGEPGTHLSNEQPFCRAGRHVGGNICRVCVSGDPRKHLVGGGSA